MTITQDRSALILGAGSSVIFGMPLGAELMEAIRLQIEAEEKKLDTVANKDFDRSYVKFLKQAVSQNNEIFSVLIHAVLYEKYSDGLKNRRYSEQKAKLTNLLGLLSNQTSETIDDFIVENPTYADLTKICIAAIFFKKLYFHNGAGISLKALAKRGFKNSGSVGAVPSIYFERNWIHLLINIVRHGIHNGQVSSSQKIKIITFNYDVILEKVLDIQFSNSEKMKGKDWRDFIDIIHPHGKCEPLNDSAEKPLEVIGSWADGIYVVQESEDCLPESVIQDRDAARAVIKESENIYAAGFSFSAPNCKMLGMGAPWNNIKMTNVPGGFDRHFRFCNYDDNHGISRAVKQFEDDRQNTNGRQWTSNTVEEQAGSPDRPLSIADWIKMGVLGELPG